MIDQKSQNFGSEKRQSLGELFHTFELEQANKLVASHEDFSKDSAKAPEVMEDKKEELSPQQVEVEASTEQEKFDDLMQTVDKFESLAQKTKEIEKDFSEAKKTKEDHYNNTNSLGRSVLSDNRRERGLVALEAEVGLSLQEMIALKGDILDKLGQLTDKRLRAKIYESFESEPSDEVGMSSEVILETKSDRHRDNLKHMALNHKALDIIGPNLKRITQNKMVGSEIGDRASMPVLEATEPVSEASEKLAEEIIPVTTDEEESNGLISGVRIGVPVETAPANEGEDEAETEAVAQETPASESTQISPDEIVKSKEPEDMLEPIDTGSGVDFAVIGPNGDPETIANSEKGSFVEDKVGAEAIPASPVKNIQTIEQPKISSKKVVDEIQEAKEKIAAGMGLKIDKPAGLARGIDNFSPRPSSVNAVVEASNIKMPTPPDLSIKEGLKASEAVIPPATIAPIPPTVVAPRVEARASAPKIETSNQANLTSEVIPNKQETAQPEQTDTNFTVDQKVESIEPAGVTVENVPTNNVAALEPVTAPLTDVVEPAIEAQQIAPMPERKRGFFGRLFGGGGDNKVDTAVQEIHKRGEALTSEHLFNLANPKQDQANQSGQEQLPKATQ